MIILYEKSTVQLTCVGLTQAHLMNITVYTLTLGFLVHILINDYKWSCFKSCFNVSQLSINRFLVFTQLVKLPLQLEARHS